MTIHVDDFMFCGEKQFESKLEEHVLKSFAVGSKQEGTFTYLGWDIVQGEEKDILISQHEYIMKELHQIQITPKRKGQKNHALTSDEYRVYKSVIGKIQWLSVQTRPDISFEVCQLSNHLSDPNVQDIVNYLNKLINRMRNEPEMSLLFKAVDMITLTLHVYSDSAYLDMEANVRL